MARIETERGDIIAMAGDAVVDAALRGVP